MASASQPFSSRPYSSALHGKLPDRGPGVVGGAGFSTSAVRGGVGASNQNQSPASGIGAPGNIPSITDEQREEVNEAFSLFDLDKDQRIDYHEFKVALKALGFTLSKPDLLSLLTAHGTPPPKNSRGSASLPNESVHPSRLQITLPAFQAIAASLISQRDPREEILRAFELFDADEKGIITLDDLRRVARELGEGLEEDEMVAMIEEFDMDGKGGVGKEEFLQICLG